jgi:hypothetical protein
MELSGTQKFVKWFSSKAKFEKIIAESQQWMFTCKCGKTTSIWDAGGIRSGAGGKLNVMLRCPHCQKTGMHTVIYENKTQ